MVGIGIVTTHSAPPFLRIDVTAEYTASCSELRLSTRISKYLERDAAINGIFAIFIGVMAFEIDIDILFIASIKCSGLRVSVAVLSKSVASEIRLLFIFVLPSVYFMCSVEELFFFLGELKTEIFQCSDGAETKYIFGVFAGVGHICCNLFQA